jgi:hypothetical protein
MKEWNKGSDDLNDSSRKVQFGVHSTPLIETLTIITKY